MNGIAGLFRRWASGSAMAVALGTASLAMAEVDLGAGVAGGETAAGFPGLARSVSESAPARDSGARFRCWQFGRLIVDEPIARVPEGATGSRQLALDGTGARPVLALDLGSAFCVAR